MSSEVTPADEVHRRRAGPLELAFERAGDRWRHTVSLVGTDGRPTLLLTSVEGSSEPGVPPSPAIQELRIETPAPGVCEFQAFGQSGGGTYSAAIRLDGNAASILFDVCARRRDAAAEVCAASTYVVARSGVEESSNEADRRLVAVPSGRSQSVDSQSVPWVSDAASSWPRSGGALEVCRTAEGSVRLEAVSPGSHKGAVWTASDAPQTPRIAVGCDAPRERTIRWQYRLLWTEQPRM